AVQRVFFAEAGGSIEQGLTQAGAQGLVVWLLVALAYQAHRGLARSQFGWILLVLVAADLLLAGRWVNPTAPAELIDREPPVAQRIREPLEDGRFYRTPLAREPALRAPSADVIWVTRWNQEVVRLYLAWTYGIPVIFHDDYNGLAPSRVAHLRWAIEALPWERRLPLLSAAAVRVIGSEDDLDLPGVEKLATLRSSGPSLYLYRNTGAARQVEWIGQYRQVESRDAALSAMRVPGFDPRQHAVVEGEVPAMAKDCRVAGRASVIEESFHRRTIAVSAECSGLLVLAEVAYPGWQARVDGRRVDILRANSAFSAIWLPAGEHEVEWRYVPRAFFLGLGISSSTLLALLIVGWIRRTRWKR
ncbi:MAG: YfhO family protein, partial [Acidobacteriota bacterium]